MIRPTIFFFVLGRELAQAFFIGCFGGKVWKFGTSVIQAARYSAWRDKARYSARRDDSIARCTLQRANQKRCWADNYDTNAHAQLFYVFCSQSLDPVRHF